MQLKNYDKTFVKYYFKVLTAQFYKNMSNLNNTIKVNKLIMFGHGFIKEIDNESQKSSVLLTVVCGLIKSMTTKTPQNQPKPTKTTSFFQKTFDCINKPQPDKC